jgi:DNA repair protein RadC
MKSIVCMSRAELVCELLAGQHSQTVSGAAVNETAIEIELSDFNQAIVSRKLQVAREILMRDLVAEMQASPVLDSPVKVGDWLRLHCAGLEHEVFILLFLDMRNRLIAIEDMFRGTLAQITVYSREVLKSALQHNASSIIVAHNHPGGDPAPSKADRMLTMQITSALALVDVKVIDHFIVTGDRVLSFAERGIL